jgi:hypothetical protein
MDYVTLVESHDWSAVSDALADLETYYEQNESHAVNTIEEIRNTRLNLPEQE